ncbi:MAG: hypothetical protein M1831_005142 [Alyxoria varia]|nr:MAG: hypothetical protein M1831_005142 [Alyxoria varia]
MSKHRRGPWSQTEDSCLLQLVHSQGAHNWVRISQLITSRSPKQCRERYHQNLKPSLNLSPISPEEGALIERLVAEMGKRWAEIARRLHGRSDNAVKNWWNGGMNRRKRLDNRRAEAVARQSQYSYQDVPSHMQSGSMRPPPSDYAQRYPQAVDHVSYSSRTHALPQPILTSNAPIQRQIREPPLPSPSTVSTASRTDSVGSTAPSLVSDMGSYSNHSHSPNKSPDAVELPPLTAVPGQNHSLPEVRIHQDGQQYQNAESDLHSPMKGESFYSPYYSYPSVHHSWADQARMVPSQSQSGYSPAGQLPLPSFKDVTAPEQRSSPTRDSRMNLSNVMS